MCVCVYVVCPPLTPKQATKFKKNKEGKWAMRMTPLEPGDMTYWGSDLWDRLDQQERRDKQMGGWTPPLAAGVGMYKYNTVAYARVSCFFVSGPFTFVFEHVWCRCWLYLCPALFFRARTCCFLRSKRFHLSASIFCSGG